jgi:hypothetical protein
MRELPEKCATFNMDGKPIMIERGESGYMLMTKDFDPDAFNKALDITEEEVNLMIVGSMFGWDVIAITKYEEGE